MARRCRTIMSSYRDSVVRCCREEGHKGDHRMDKAGQQESSRSMAEFMRRSFARAASNQDRSQS